MAEVEREFVTTKEAAKIAGVTDKTIRNWINRGRLHPSVPGSSDGKRKRGSPLRIALTELRGLLTVYEAKPEPPKEGT